MLHKSRVIPYIVLSVLLSGCAANDLMVKRQAESEAKIELLLQTSKKAEQLHNELAAVQQSEDDKLKALTDEIKQLREENRAVKASQSEISIRIARLVQQSQTPKVEIVNQPSSAKTADSGPPPDYLKAFGLYSANNFVAAIESFNTFLKNNLQSEYLPNALYWIGECYYSLSDFAKAKEAFLKVTEVYPNSPKTPDALLKLGYTYAALKDKDAATGIFEKTITLYPGSSAAKKARERLNTH